MQYRPNHTHETTTSPEQPQKKYLALYSDPTLDAEFDNNIIFDSLQENVSSDQTKEPTNYDTKSSPDNKYDDADEIQLLDLSVFKIYPCSNYSKHNHKECPYYHYSKDRRRSSYNYFGELCEFFDNAASCPKGDSCPHIHSRAEQLYTPEKYKTKFCACYPGKISNCEFGAYCSFAHHEREIRIPLIDYYHKDFDFYMFHYKTILCPYNLSEHDKTTCIYAHNWQDYRRKPSTLNYEARLCPDWKTSEFIKNYEDGGCPLNEKCLKCHGWKELEYHPEKYKTKGCTLKKCLGGRICPYFHSPEEKRPTSPINFFKVAPKNRVIEKNVVTPRKQVNKETDVLRTDEKKQWMEFKFPLELEHTGTAKQKKPLRKPIIGRDKENTLKLKKDPMNFIFRMPDDVMKIADVDHIKNFFENFGS